MSAKSKGTRNEHRSRRLLEAVGYAVTRAAASLGVWDLVGISPVDVVLVQVKTGRLPPPAERETLEEFPCPTNCKKLVHIWYPRQRLPRTIEIRSH